jgi:hypothetical protein
MISYLQSIQHGAVLSGSTSAMTARQQLSLSIMAAQAQHQHHLEAQMLHQQANQQLVPSTSSSMPSMNLMQAMDQYRSGESSSTEGGASETAVINGKHGTSTGEDSNKVDERSPQDIPIRTNPGSNDQHSGTAGSSSGLASSNPLRPNKQAKYSGAHSTTADSPKKHTPSPGRALFGPPLHNPHNLFGNDASASSLQAIKSELAASMTPPPVPSMGASLVEGAPVTMFAQQIRSPSILSRSRGSPMRSTSTASTSSSVGSAVKTSPSILRSPSSGLSAAIRKGSPESAASGQTDSHTRSTVRRMGGLDLHGETINTPPRQHTQNAPPPGPAVVTRGAGGGNNTGAGIASSPGSSFPSGKLLDLAGIIEDR